MQLPFSNLQLKYQHPQASAPLILPVQAVCNQPEDVINGNIRINSRRTDKWLFARPAHDLTAVLCGSGPSIKDDLPRIRGLVRAGAKIFALNGAAKFLFQAGIMPDYQVILDAQEATADLVGPAVEHLFASQVHPKCFDRVPNAMLWHLQVEGIDDLIPPFQGNYTLIGAASSVGTTALVVAYALGFRELKCFGYDSSHRLIQSHVIHQPMNDGEPTCSVAFNGKHYRTSLTMKMQAERFPVIAALLQREGCKIDVFGSGLLPDIWNAPTEALSEKEKYERMWAIPEYRVYSPGASAIEQFLAVVNPEAGATVLDFGAGSGKASVKLAEAGLSPMLVDFAGNCRDEFAMHLPFFQFDLTEPIPLRSKYAICCDVMEHIPPLDTRKALGSMFEACPRVFFRIDTKPDVCGAMINQSLHLCVMHHDEWRAMLEEYGKINFEERHEDFSVFYVVRQD